MKLFISGSPFRTRYELITMTTLGHNGIAGLIEAKEKGITKEVIADSGAYSILNRLKADKKEFYRYALKYAEWLNKLFSLGAVDYFVELDVDTVLPLREIEKLREILIAETGREPVVVWHTIRGVSYFYEMIERYAYVGLPKWSTLLDNRYQMISGRKVDMLGVYRRFIKDAKAKGVKVHLFGTGLSYDALALKPDSCDVSVGAFKTLGSIYDATHSIKVWGIFGLNHLTVSDSADKVDGDFVAEIIRLQDSFAKL